MNPPEYEVRRADVTTVEADLLLLKHAQAFYGADNAVASLLVDAGLCRIEDLSVEPGKHALVGTRGIMAPSRVLFVGTPPLQRFGYDEMQEFARRAIEVLALLDEHPRVMTTTVHGTGYGLDGGESLQRLIQGFEQGLAASPRTGIERIAFLTLGERAARTLASVAATICRSTDAHRAQAPQTACAPTATPAGPAEPNEPVQTEVLQAVGPPTKKRVFVAMPYADEFENVYEYGIYPAVRDCGFICEKVNEVHFTGDIVSRIRQGIETAALVIADLTGARPNVYLEVGYAWGRGAPVILLARNGESLHFDVGSHRCVYYGKYARLADDLRAMLKGLEAAGEI